MPGDFDFGLTDAQETHARALHEASISIAVYGGTFEPFVRDDILPRLRNTALRRAEGS